MYKVRGKQLVSGVLVMVLGLGLLSPVSASELTNKQSELQQIRNKKNALNNKKKQVEGQKSVLVDQLDGIKTEIDQLEGQIDNEAHKLTLAKKEAKQANLELQLAEEDLLQQKELLGERVRDIYINGQVSYLEVLFQAESFSDFLNRFELMKIIVENDKRVLEEIDAKRETLSDKKQRVETKQKQIAQLLSSQETKKNEMEGKQDQYDQKLDQAKKDVVEYEQEISRLEELESKKAAELIRLQQSKNKNSKAKGTGVYAWPAPGHERITSSYGWRMHPILGVRKLHTGVDIGAPSGADVVAAQSGTVIYSGWMNGYGNTIILDHGAGMSTLYAHQSKLLVSVGAEVSKGDTIGKVGSTGRSTGPHLHFEVRKDGDPIDPTSYI